MENKEILEEFEKRFNYFKAKSGLKAGLDELDVLFSIRDSVLHEGFASNMPARQISARIGDMMNNWLGYIHSILMPNPSDLINQTEAKLFAGNDERKIILELVKEMRIVSTLGQIARLQNDIKKEAEFIDEAVKLCRERLFPELSRMSEKINSGWKGKN